jgi:hypothetical protein
MCGKRAAGRPVPRAVSKTQSSVAAHLPNVKQTFALPPALQKNSTILFRKRISDFNEGEFPMRLAHAIFLGSVAALLTLAAPTLARNSNSSKASEAPASVSCQAYQQSADGTWKQLPCQETGAKAQPQPRSASKGATEETR